MKTHYNRLGVTRHASYSDIERSYRHSLNEYIAGSRNHPLRKKEQLRLQQMRKAYLVLSSPSRRLEYDLELDQMEHARLRRIERVGTALGLALLVAGLALIAHSYYRQVYEETSALQTAQTASAAPKSTLLAGGGRPHATAAASNDD